MKRSLLILILYLFANACSPKFTPLPAPAQTATEESFPFAQALIAANRNDLAQLNQLTRYDITLEFNPTGPTLVGREDVRYFNRQSAAQNEIFFRLFANYPESNGKIVINTLSVDRAPTQPTYQMQNTTLRVAFAKPLLPNTSTELHMDFSVTIPRDNKTHYADFTFTDGIVTLPTVYPLIPAFDAKGWRIELSPAYGDLVYAETSQYAVTITAPSTMTVIASGSTIAMTENPNRTTTWKMVGAPVRDFGIVISDQFQKTSGVVGETTVNSYYEVEDAESGKKVLQVAMDAIRIFSNRFGTYPYREFDVVETPTTAGGIEYPGMVIIGKELYRGTRGRDTLEFVVAHEVAHQWWYGVVGNDQVNEPWVDEPLAQYSTIIYSEDLHGATAAQNLLKVIFTDPYTRAKSQGHDAPANLPVSAYSESDYVTMVYQKAPLFYDAIRKKMGDEKFFQFLRTYFQKFRYKIARGEDVLNTAESVGGSSLREEFQKWIAGPATAPAVKPSTP